jgi:hypothetical protein
MEIYSLVACFFFFWQWKESVLCYVDRTYISVLAKQQAEEGAGFDKKDLFNSNLINI